MSYHQQWFILTSMEVRTGMSNYIPHTYITLVAIIGTTILVPYLWIKSLHLIWRVGISFEGRAPVKSINGCPIFKRVAGTWPHDRVPGDSSPNNGRLATYHITYGYPNLKSMAQCKRNISHWIYVSLVLSHRDDNYFSERGPGGQVIETLVKARPMKLSNAAYTTCSKVPLCEKQRKQTQSVPCCLPTDAGHSRGANQHIHDSQDDPTDACHSRGINQHIHTN